MHTTRRKGFRGKIKVGFCSGNYVCKNDECPYRRSNPELKRNEQNWQYMEGRRVCKHCGVWGTGKECGARKLVEYNTNMKEVIVYHLGQHTCTPRIDTAKYDNVMSKAISKNIKIGPVALKTLKVNEAVNNLDIDAAYEIAEKFNTSRMKLLKRKLAKEICPDTHSFEAVGILKK